MAYWERVGAVSLVSLKEAPALNSRDTSPALAQKKRAQAAPKNKIPCPTRSPPPAALLPGYSHGRCGKSTNPHNKLTRHTEWD